MRRRLGDPRLVLAAAVVLGAVIATPIAVLASHTFADVPNENIFHADIDALADSGVTTGCGGPNYCPKDYVTREQMAGFMNRLGALDPGKTPVVNAATLDGLEKGAFMPAGDIVMRQLGTWRPWSTEQLLFYEEYNATLIHSSEAGTKVAVLHLAGPASIGGKAYGLKSVQVCWPGSSGFATGIITQTRAIESVNSNAMTLIDNGTDRSLFSPDCHTVTDATPTPSTGGVMVAISLVYPNAMSMRVSHVSATWTPMP